MSNKQKKKQPKAPFSSRRKRLKWTTIVIWLMIIAMFLTTFTMFAGMFL